MSLQQMREELRRKYERLAKEEERRKTMLKYYERIKVLPWPPRSNPELEYEEILDKTKAEYWIELLKMAVLDPTLDKTEKARIALNLVWMSGEHLELEEFTKFARRWRLLTARLEEPLTSSSPLAR